MLLRTWRCLEGGAIAALFLSGCAGSSGNDLFSPRSSDWTPASEQAMPAPSALRESAGEQEEVELPDLDESALLADYLTYAAVNNPGLEAAFQRWQAAVQRVPQVEAMPDPRFTYGYYIEEVETRTGSMQHQFMVSQTFPWFGKLQDRGDAAAREANAAYQQYQAEKLDLFYRVKAAHFELWFLRRSIEITEEMEQLLQQVEASIRAQYRLATADHPGLIRIQVELSELSDRIERLRDLRAPYSARLNAALNRRSDAELPWPSDVPVVELQQPLPELMALVREANPRLLALSEQTERERAAAEVARKDGLPDLTVGLSYTMVNDRDGSNVSGNGDDPILATFSVNVPLWREKYDAAQREILARRLAVASTRLEESNRLQAELQQSAFEHQDARRRIELYESTLLPKATESLRVTLASYETGTSTYLDLLDTERTLLEFQLALERAQVDRALSFARLEQLVGQPLAIVPSESVGEAGAPADMMVEDEQ